MRKRMLSIFLATLVACVIYIPSITAAAAGAIVPEITRLAGKTRYDTACEISSAYADLRGNHSSNDAVLNTVVIANGQNYADALAGVPLADYLNAPILLTKGGNSLEPEVIAKIKGFGAKTAFILGGSTVVSEGILNQLKEMGMTVTRLSGDSRYDTAVEIAQFNFDFFDVTKTAFLVSGENFPDALSAGSVAGITRSNILFCPQSGEIKESVAELIKKNGINSIVIVGGPNAIGERVEIELNAIGVTAKRVYGFSRYATSLAVYQEYSDKFDLSVLTFATGANFPDALAGGVLSAEYAAPVILLDNNCDNSAAAAALKDVPVNKVFIYGGDDVLSQKTVTKVLGNRPASTTTTTEIINTTTSRTTATTTSLGDNDYWIDGWY